MDDKTEELRDLFLSVSDEETVTESQSEGRGTLTDESDAAEQRLREGIEQLREKFGFSADLSDAKRCRIVERFYDGETDEEIAAALDIDPGTVLDARMDLHLIREDEPALDEGVVEIVRNRPDADPADLAAATDTTEAEIRRCRAVLEAAERSRRVSHRYRTLFEETLTDVDLTDPFAADAHDDGLADATEGAETDVDM